MILLKPLLAILVLGFAVCGQSGQPPLTVADQDGGLTIAYIANEGISISSGGNKILLDAIHRRYKPDYAFTPEAILTKIESARYPYKDVKLVLVSHNHLDHFHAESIARMLSNNSNAVLISSDQVIDAVEAVPKNVEPRIAFSEIKPEQIKRIKHEWKSSVDYDLGWAKVTFLGLLHANSKLPAYREIQNFGHLIEIGGKKLLHIGDADMFADNFRGLGLEDESVDVAFVPYWFLLAKDGREILKKELKAKAVVAIHVPPTGQSKAMREILGAFPSAIVFSQEGEMLNF